MPNYGTDLSTYGGAEPDLSFKQISGKRAIAEAVARRWTTERGSLQTDPNAGFDLSSVLNAALDQTALYTLSEALQSEAEKDERIASCVVKLTLTYSTSTLRIDGMIDPATPDDDAFEFVFTLTADTLPRLEVR